MSRRTPNTPKKRKITKFYCCHCREIHFIDEGMVDHKNGDYSCVDCFEANRRAGAAFLCQMAFWIILTAFIVACVAMGWTVIQ